jgi:N-acetyl-1-D-myo-inositol-2-amino-2-deoxy-alpha-D-glucopyranoside deacetylase
MTTEDPPSRPSAGSRLLFVHAHPDDETINNGATMARYVAEGAQVTLITCTRGEQGEVIPERLAHLATAAAGGSAVDGDALGEHRVEELAAAMAALGVTDHRFLGDDASPGRSAAAVLADGGTVYRDSGMAYGPDGEVIAAPDSPEGAFALADPEEEAALLAAVIVELRPQVVVGYEPGGGYGHPDHVRAHLITMRAIELAAGAGDSAWTVPKVYWVVMPESLVRATFGALASAEGTGYHGPDPAGRMPSEVVPDSQVTTAIDAMAYTSAKIAALRAHLTQVSVSPDGAFYALSNEVRRPIIGLEFYQLIQGARAEGKDDLSRETTLL